MAGEERAKLRELLKQLDVLNLGQLTLDDVRQLKNPVLAQALRDFLSSKAAESHHNSHFVHISHYSSLVAQGTEANP
jgi:hypothetical protein